MYLGIKRKKASNSYCVIQFKYYIGICVQLNGRKTKILFHSVFTFLRMHKVSLINDRVLHFQFTTVAHTATVKSWSSERRDDMLS